MVKALAGGFALFLLAGLPCPADTAHADEWFSRLPFAQWSAAGERSDLPWTADILPAEISPHQRIMLRVVIRLHGAELEKRRGPGAFVTLVQYKDSAGRIWQHHTSMELTHVPLDAGGRQFAIAQYAYVLPGDYSLTIAVCDTETMEHGLITRQVHVDRLEQDPLPQLWTGLPAVDFIPPITDPPDVWYLPGVEGRLNIPVSTSRPVHIHLLVNITPSWQVVGSLSAMQQNMNAVIPVMKVLSQMQLSNGTLDIALLDLTNVRVAFEQTNPAALNWDGMRQVFLNTNPGLVDARSLASQRKMSAFFRKTILDRLMAANQDDKREVPVLIVLSGPTFLQEQDAATRVNLSATPEHRIFYIRCNDLRAPPADDLERIATEFNARLYDAASKFKIRDILASILNEISRL